MSTETSASKWAKPVVDFDKLDDLPKDKPYTAMEIMKAMKALHAMVHAQAHHYGGEDSKLLPVGIAEGALTLKEYLSLLELSKNRGGDDGEDGEDEDGTWKKVLKHFPGLRVSSDIQKSLKPFIGKRVTFKVPTDKAEKKKWLVRRGTVSLDPHKIVDIQKDYKGDVVFRVVSLNMKNDFGRLASIEELNIE